MSDMEDVSDVPEENRDDDLFGDSDDEVVRALSDQPKDSDQEDQDVDEDGRRKQKYPYDERELVGDDDDDAEDESIAVRDKIVETAEITRHRIPKTQDGMLQTLRVPGFLRILPEIYNPNTFEPSEKDIENAQAENPKAEVRVRRDATSGQLQSNATIHRWSDGSLTLSVGDEMFELGRKALAPPADKPYQELQDAHYYVAAPDLRSNHFMMVGHVREQYTVRPGQNAQEEALQRLAERMAAAKRGVHEGDMIIRTTQDPELQKRQAEQAEKERMKAQRRRETAAAKMDLGQRFGRSGGLTIGDLEGSRNRAGGARKRGAAGATKASRRRPEYDSDDDLPSGAKRAGNEYDLGDDFIAPSDDDGSGSEAAEEDEEDLLDDDDEEDDAPRKKRQRTAEADDDAEGDLDDELPAEHMGRSRRRNVIDDDDE